MRKNLFDRRFLFHFLLFCLFNFLLYLFIALYHSAVPFHRENYISNSHHFLTDPRIQNLPFNLLSGLAQYDSQWYMKIAVDGYTFSPQLPFNIKDKTQMQNLVYGFFPIYPLIISALNFILGNIQLSAFIISNFFLLSGFISLYLVVSDFYSPPLAIKASWLLYTFPFSIFFRSFYPEGLLVFLLIWFAYFLLKKKWFYAGLVLAFVNVTKGSVTLLNIFYFWIIIDEFLRRRFRITRLILLLFLPVITVLGWLFYNFMTTGNPFYFSYSQSLWATVPYPVSPLLYSLFQISDINHLQFHDFHSSQVECIAVLILAYLILISRRRLNHIFWWLSLAVFLTPLLIRGDLSSFSRYQSVSFPIFVYLSQKLRPALYYPLLIIFIIGLFWISLYFVNWYWVG
jgi:hypothetical protein